MSRLYASPLRVYLCLAALAICGILSGMNLPVSLFPNSQKPMVRVYMPVGGSTADEFVHTYGYRIEEGLRAISTETLDVETVKAEYSRTDVNYTVEFKWGGKPREALREVQAVISSMSAMLPSEVRDNTWTWIRAKNSGFLSISFYSPKRTLDELYGILDPILTPRIAKVPDAMSPELYNPAEKQILVELNPEKMAALQLFPKDVDRSVQGYLSAATGGSVSSPISGQTVGIEMPRLVTGVRELGLVPVLAPGGKAVHLGDLARIDYTVNLSDARGFKTSGAPSVILFATPRAGGNIKKMSEDLKEIVSQAMPSLPPDVQYKVLVDPSEFINSSVHNVMREVMIGGLLAVAILYLFIGSFRNTVTAAIEIPLSMVLAFILMKISGMNLNLISLGGLALSAGMNVDASVVVMENIFRHFEGVKGELSFERKLGIVVEAVKEVRFPVIASTIASLVVFLPLAFTSALSYAILGDLAKTVVFSHGFSAFVALILVPTVRLQLMSGKAAQSHPKAPIERQMRWLERAYGRALERFLGAPKLRTAVYAGIALSLVALTALVLPRLPKEIIGMPDSDILVLGIETRGNSQTRQMEGLTEETEAAAMKEIGDRVQYTFTEIDDPNSADILLRLKDKREMQELWKKLEARFTNTPLVKFEIRPFNPAELPIPDPPQLRIVVQGGSLERRAEAARGLRDLIDENHVLPRITNQPDVEPTRSIVLRSKPDQWTEISTAVPGLHLQPDDLADLVRVATQGRRLGRIPLKERLTDIYLKYPESSVKTVEDVASLPIGAGSKLIPLRALVSVGLGPASPSIYRENGKEHYVIEGKRNQGSDDKADRSFMNKAHELVEGWQAAHVAAGPEAPVVSFEDAEKDMNEALRQLASAVGLSIVLIFLTLLIQFGDVMNALLVLVAVPLGFIGVLASLFVFRSTLSLNSVLGVILLNGIAVANSIILVDFQKKLVERGLSPKDAAVQAGQKRLRPILITSLTTILAMLPIAAGMGEGGRILQPLGIAVSGGLWVSMGLTLFVVPALQVSYLNYIEKKKPVSRFVAGSPLAEAIGGLGETAGIEKVELTQ